MTQLDSTKLEWLAGVTLLKGSHPANDGMCAMEAVAYLAGEPHSDAPACASPVLAAFMRRWNDDLDDEGRQRLKPYLPRLVGTRASAAVEDRRAWMLTDWMIRVHTPAWLDLAGLVVQATTLRALPEIDATAVAWSVQGEIDAARDAARAAAWAAAGAAVKAKLAPTVASLQASAFALLDALIECGEGGGE